MLDEGQDGDAHWRFWLQQPTKSINLHKPKPEPKI
jgi:hypothetical protein